MDKLNSQILSQFLKAKRPLFFIGNGVKLSGLKDLLIETAEATDIPVMVTSHAKSVFPENHDLYAGTFGFASSDNSTQFLKSYQPDAILFIATRLGELSTLGWSDLLKKPELKIHVDIDKNQLDKTYKMDFTLNAQASSIFNELISLSNKNEKLDLNTKNDWSAIIKKINLNKPIKESRLIDLDKSPIHPEDFIVTFNDQLPNNAKIFSDIGSTMAWIINKANFKSQQEFFVPIGLGSMGSGINAALGAKTIFSKQPVVCLTGDVSMLMQGNELFTAKENNINVIFVVLNNGGHGMVEQGNKFLGYTSSKYLFDKKVNFAKWAEAFGVEAFTINTIREFLNLPLDKIFHSHSPVLIDLNIDNTIMPPILARAKTLLGQHK